MTEAFIHLHTHSEYSLIDGIVRIDDYVEQARQSGMWALALTDHMNLFAAVKFYQAAVAAGIKPILGADIVYTLDEENYHATLLCKDQQGYRNLTELISKAYITCQKGIKPTILWQDLTEHNKGLIVLAKGQHGEIGNALMQGNTHLAQERLKRWLNFFDKHFYLTIQRTNRPHEEEILHAVVALATEHGIPVVATNEVRFMQAEDFEAHEARVCIAQGYVLDDAKRPRQYSEQQYLKSTEEMQELFSDIPEALANSAEIAKRCTVKMNLGQVYLPKFPTPNQEPEEFYFQQLSQRGLAERLEKCAIVAPEAIQPYHERLATELQVINAMGFAGYFLIVADFIKWAKANGIPVGPGRGSGAGSLVAYVLGITELDPLKHELLFERFLNPERISLPDFDVDFCMEGRDRVIEYVAERYGHEAVAQIITYGTMAAKAVVRDVGRVLGLPYGFVDKIAKLIPFELGITLTKAMQQEEELAERYQNEDEVKTLIDLALKLEGITRNAGKHAGGVVIAPTRLTDFTALYCEEAGAQPVTQFDKDDVETIGLVKFDFLGLRTLTIINWALQTINRQRLQQNLAPIDIDTLPLDDEQTYALLKRCSTTAVFQLESRGMKDLIRRLQPDIFEDITALVALFRPGPLQSGMVDDFINRKHGRARVDFPHPCLEPILAPTYGVILYQEQVMQIARVLSGYTLGGADILRRAMGKKKPEEMAKQRAVFVGGAEKNGIEARVAEAIFDLVEKFAGYGFNKSHSAAYALIAYQTAWLKAHYPAEFMAAVLSSDMDNTDKVVAFIEECRVISLVVKPPNINEGFYHFTVNAAGEILYGLGAIKGVGENLVQDLVVKRQQGGAYKNLFEFCLRIEARKLTRRGLEPLIKSGAFDVWGVKREELMATIDKALKFATQTQRNIEQGQNDLFGESTLEKNEAENMHYLKAKPWSDLERLNGEKDTLGLYLTGHPLETCRTELEALVNTTINQLQSASQSTVVIAGILLGVRVITTRSGKRMAIATFEDCTGRIEVTIFSDLYQNVARTLTEQTIFLVKGTPAKDEYSGGIKLIAEAVMSLDDARVRRVREIKIRVGSTLNVDDLLRELPELVKQADGRCPIKIVYETADAVAELKLGDSWRVKPSSELLTALKELCGQDCVDMIYF